MQLVLRRSQHRSGLVGSKVTFALDARVDLDPHERELISKYKLETLVIYDSVARKRRAAVLRDQFEEPVPISATPAGLAGAGLRATWKMSRIAATAAMMALSLRVTVDTLAAGQHVECRDLDELLGAEGAIREACANLRVFIDTAESFDGREEVTEY